ncbi:MAG: hypothetical protein KDC87_13025 [Planctomycetes bacterium]|nr:hypothetical protein [Planctomycetota bacterium]MCB9868993.1 hypothetical protein [Planctomycetota bacterium]MCB9887953.1 hypothetical protein [Planctomycetota bacterium]
MAEASREEEVDLGTAEGVEDLEGLMGDPGAEAAEGASDGRLAARAAAAARAARQATDEPDAQGQAAASPARRSPPMLTRDRVLVALLGANLLLMAVMVLLPNKKQADPTPTVPAAQHPDTPHAAAAHTTEPFVAPLREPDQMLPNHEMYDAAQLQVAKGDYPRAIELLLAYRKAHPALQPFQQEMVLNSLAYCYQKVGKRDDARRMLGEINNLRELTSLPDDLWKLAEQAEKDQRGSDMRRYYARFLLQQDQLGKRWSDQSKIAEAYMRIGDSYRIDAERAARNDAPQSSINRKVAVPAPGSVPAPAKKPAAKPHKGGH